MNGIPRLCAAALLIVATPMAIARSSAQEAPPEEGPKAAQPAGQPATAKPPVSEVRKEVDQAVDAIRGYSSELREQAMANAKRAVEDLDGQMARLQAQTEQGWDRMSQAARTRSRATMADLRQRRNALAEWYGGMRHGSTTAWAEVRSGFVTSYHELADALRKARAELDQDEPDRAAEQAPSDDAP